MLYQKQLFMKTRIRVSHRENFAVTEYVNSNRIKSRVMH